MGLSEQERRMFEAIEQQLNDEDPGFVHSLRGVTVAGRRGRRLRLAAGALVIGFVLLLGLVVNQALGFAGFGLMFVGVVVGARELQTVEGDFGQRVRALLGRDDDDA